VLHVVRVNINNWVDKKHVVIVLRVPLCLILVQVYVVHVIWDDIHLEVHQVRNNFMINMVEGSTIVIIFITICFEIDHELMCLCLYVHVACQSCTAGRYTDRTGQSSCFLCQPGQQQPFIQATACVACSVGKFSQSNETLACTECPVGHYLNETGGTEGCKPCSEGYYQFNSGQSQCLACPTGSKADTPGSRECTICSTGTYQDKEGQLTCNACPAGSHQQYEGMDGYTISSLLLLPFIICMCDVNV
jgi:hypothetical protein